MPRTLSVHLLPELTTSDELAGGAVVVIDVLRATTTIAYALAAGAREVIPCLEVEQARAVAARLPAGACVLGGERAGVRIAGFDLGNSPAEYSPQTVGGKTLAFTTTNGTKAMMRCGPARQVLLGAFVNFLAVARMLSASREPIHLLCAGTAGQITREDAALAGCLTYLLTFAGPGEFELNDQAALLEATGERMLAEALANEDHALAVRQVREALRQSQGGRNLLALGLASDIDAAAEIDRFQFVPHLDVGSWTIAAPE